MQAISRILASRATMLAPILVATPWTYDWNRYALPGAGASFGCSPRITARVLLRGRDEAWGAGTLYSKGLRAVPANGPAG